MPRDRQMEPRKRLVLIRPLAGVLDSVNPVIPIPLLAICRHLDLDAYDVVIVDQRFPHWRHRLERALAGDVLLVGLTCLTGYQIHFGSALARFVRRRRPGVPIVWGGVHPTAEPLQTLRESFVDFVVVGEGEWTFPELVDALAAGIEPTSIPGVGYKTPGGSLRLNPPRPLMDISGLPDLPYHLVDMRAYVADLEDAPFYGVEGARGCVHNCTFCYNLGYNQRQWRPRDPGILADNLARVHRDHGVRNFFIADDSFFVSAKRALTFARNLVDLGLRVSWGTEANVSMMARLDSDALSLLARSGLDFLSMGVESGSRKVLEFVNKPVDLDEVEAFNRRLRRWPIHPKYTFMTGTPVESKADVRKSVDLVRLLLHDNPRALIQAFYMATPYPGTVYLEQCRAFGFEPPESLAGWADFDPFAVARHLPWVRGDKKQLFEFMMYCSMFVDGKVDYHLSDSLAGRLTAMAGKAYRPLARFRFFHLLYRPYPEAAAFKLVNSAQKVLSTVVA